MNSYEISEHEAGGTHTHQRLMLSCSICCQGTFAFEEIQVD